MGGRRVGAGVQVVRNRTNQVCGWLIWVLLTGVWCLNDPMGFVYPEPGWATRLQGLLATVGFAVASMLGVLVFAVPYVGLGSRAVVVQNFLSRRVVPREVIAGVREDGSWPVLRLMDGGRVRLFGAERSTLMQMRGLSVLDDQRLGQSEKPVMVQAPREVERVWVVPVQVRVVAAFWGVLIVIGSVFGRYI